MAVLLLFVLVHREPTRNWIVNRCLSELLRRERFFCLAKLGGYATNVPATLIARQAKFNTDSFKDIDKLIALTGFEPPGNTTLADVKERLHSYIHHRIQRQIGHFRWSLADIQYTSVAINAVLVLALLIALLAAAVQLIPLPSQSAAAKASEGQTTSFANSAAAATNQGTGSVTLDPASRNTQFVASLASTVGLFSKVMPGLAGFAIALSSLLRLDLLEGIYSKCLDELREGEEKAIALLATIGNLPGLEATERFQQIVWEVENALTQELNSWIIITNRSHSV
jgi:hypothetical protein